MADFPVIAGGQLRTYRTGPRYARRPRRQRGSSCQAKLPITEVGECVSLPMCDGHAGKRAGPVTTPGVSAPPLLNQLSASHLFGWTRGVQAPEPRSGGIV